MGRGGNPYHDKRGRFTTANGAYTRTGESALEYGRGKQRQRGVREWADVTSSHGSDSGSYVVTDKTTGARVGRMGYNVWNTGAVMVNGLRVENAYQRRGVAKEMLRQLAQDFPNAVIEPGPVSHDGGALYEALRGLPEARNRIGKPMRDFMAGGTPVGRRS
jgi:predicted GNAT family acetyltransferase